jgi:2-methylcitrate dehydratase PrpD
MQATGSMQVVLDGDPPAKAVYAAFSNHGGLLSALLASKGLDAQIAAFEGRAGLFELHVGGPWEPREIERGLGEDYRLLDVRFKPWPCSGVTHPFIKAALELGTVTPAEVREIKLRGSPRARHWFEPEKDRRKPTTTAAAANSVFYVVAHALANGSVGLEDFSPSAVARPATLVDCMTYTLEETLGSKAIIQVEMRDGRVLSAHSGEVVSMTEDDLVRKFMDCAKFSARPLDAERSVEKVLDLETQRDIGLLLTD